MKTIFSPDVINIVKNEKFGETEKSFVAFRFQSPSFHSPLRFVLRIDPLNRFSHEKYVSIILLLEESS